MSDYRIVFEKAAIKFLKKQDKSQQERLLRAINKLPHEGDIKHLTGYDNLYRLRVGGYRVLFSKDTHAKIVNIENIDNRGQVYK